jgi:hypothetical protein
MVKLEINKLPIILPIVMTLVSSLMISTVSFGDVFPGPNGEYCSVTFPSYRSTVANPWGTFGYGSIQIPVAFEYSKGCTEYQVFCIQVDSNGNNIGNWYMSGIQPIINYGTYTQSFELPTSSLIKGEEYKVEVTGFFPWLSSCPFSTGYFIYG